MQAEKTHPGAASFFSVLGIIMAVTIATTLVLVTISRTGIVSFWTHPETVHSTSTTITTENFRFGPGELQVKVGQMVTLNLNNQDLLPHSFDVDEFDLHVDMPGKQSVSASFTPQIPGTFTIYCDLPGHREAGMVGTLVVAP